MVLVAIAVKLDSSGPMLYRQPRLGKNGCVFILNKFRSMRQDAEKDTGPVWSGQRDPRITRVGNILRRTRLDELPQLYNVLVGRHELHRAPAGAPRVRGRAAETDPLSTWSASP